MHVMTRFYVKEVHTPIGLLTIVSSDKGLTHLSFGPLNKANLAARLARFGMKPEWLELGENESLLAAEQLMEYFNGERQEFDVSIDLIGTPFQKKVWSALNTITYGETKSYKEIAEMIGAPKAVRAVGGANNQNPLPIIIPCHRVIGSNGAMVGYGGGLTNKERLLSLESKMKIS
ncbi:methylated-DNA--[protein]-cysteine S-methyltransferase [Shouchella sp. JSM 1781072]|uniref:methylated-DNA--[protein]-cysteine S-methyltransferase n=1 Tax=Bacillaceae TaxID=186817 RepID=UPI000C078876|nr:MULTISPECIES: methylated-DNA--[protein]-cysteine S-methyltransferase [Bacillaceae]UTR07760.1 methylated-DNA--[protein]-cysteine S-methyltransferase [Alkalihalobacillus sp. LMS6]